ncbi:hypothetical protein Tco_0545536 [Tanacetum coccineum]
MHDSKTFNNVFYALKEDLIYATEFKIQEMAREVHARICFRIYRFDETKEQKNETRRTNLALWDSRRLEVKQ